MSALPLSGITVVALEQVIAGPFCTRQLADLGARVIKIERPGGGDQSRGYDRTVRGLSSHFVWVNRSKESVTLDLKQDAARQVLAKLVERADVFVQNLAPGAAGRLGFGAEELRRRHPRLVVCGISGYGEDGPYSVKKAYDLLVQCEAGLVSVTGTPESPAKAGIPVADIAAAMYAFSGILAALLRRRDSGEGATLDVSMFESLGEWMGFPAYFTAYGGSPPPRAGAFHATIVPYGPYRAGDGRDVFLGIQNEREFGRFCADVLGRPDLPQDARFASSSARNAHRADMKAVIEECLSGIAADEVIGRLEQAEIANASLNDMRAFWDHPQLRARNRWRSVATEAGEIDTLLPPINFSDCEPRIAPIPAAGQHTRAILAELGYASDAIDRLAADGAI